MLDVMANIEGFVLSALTGGLGVAVFQYFAGQKKLATDNKKTSVETTAAEQRVIDARLETLSKQLAESEATCIRISEKNKATEKAFDELQSKMHEQEQACQEVINQQRLTIQILQEQIVLLTAKKGLS